MLAMTRPRGKVKEVRQSTLETYLRDINQTPLLTPEEERELAYRVEEGDSEARDLMVRANLRLVVSIARTFTGQGLSIQDLIEEGNLGLLRAAEGFDPSMNTRFSTYASYWIRQSMKRAVVNTGKMIRIPSYMVELLNKWRRATSKLHDELGRSPSFEEVGRMLGLPKKQMAIIKKAIRVCTVTPQSDHEAEGWSMDERVLDSRTKAPELQLGEAEDRQRVLELLDRLDQREATILRMRYGLDNEAPNTLQGIGERLGLTRERVRQIENEALRKLSERLHAQRA
jgi:RNA polymerase primary sigma factor